MSFSIIVDSCCDLTPEMRADPVFRSIPLTIRVGGKDYIDDQNLDTSLLIYAMDQSPDASSSSCPSPGDYLEAFRQAEGDLYVVTLSALLSGSHNSAWQAKQMLLEEEPERNIHVFNSCSASAGEVLLAQAVRQLAGSGLPFAQVVARAEQTIAETNTLFVLENLEKRPPHQGAGYAHRRTAHQAHHGLHPRGGDLQARSGPVCQAGAGQDSGHHGGGR